MSYSSEKDESDQFSEENSESEDSNQSDGVQHEYQLTKKQKVESKKLVQSDI